MIWYQKKPSVLSSTPSACVQKMAQEWQSIMHRSHIKQAAVSQHHLLLGCVVRRWIIATRDMQPPR